MKVLFLEDVRPTARAGDVKEVKNGFARNYLIPRGIAVLANEHELRRAEKLRQEAEERRLKEASEWNDVATQLAEAAVEITVRTGPTGRLYGSVTNTMIAATLSEMTGREIDRKGIRIPSPIRTVGDHPVEVRLAEGVETTLKIQVRADEESLEQARAIEQAVQAATTEDTAQIVDPSFEEVLQAAEARIDEEIAASKDEGETPEPGAESEESDDSDKESGA